MRPAKRRIGRIFGITAGHADGNGSDPLEKRSFFQDLPADIQMVVLQGVKFRLAREALPGDLGLLDLDDLLDEGADDLINRHNARRTIRQWLEFAEEGE
jgi:hypothetical protein